MLGANRFREGDFKGKPNFDTLGFPLTDFFVGTLSKQPSGLFVDSDPKRLCREGGTYIRASAFKFLPILCRRKESIALVAQRGEILLSLCGFN